MRRFLVDVLGQRRTISERPVAGTAHAFVFWGFLAFALYTAVEFLDGLGIADLTGTAWFHAYRVALTPFAVAVLAGIVYLAVRRAFFRPVALGAKVSVESIVIAVFIATLMITFLLTWRLDEASVAGRVNWWVHAIVILAFLALIPASKHFHLVLSPVTVFLKSPELGNVPNLDFEKEQVGLETVKDLGSKTVLDAFTCVECGRCQVNCPAWGAGKELNPKDDHPADEGRRCSRASPRPSWWSSTSDKVLWQCTTCGACENQCPVGIEHLPLIIGARRGLVSNGEAPDYLGRRLQPSRAARQHLGAELRPAAEVRGDQTALEMFDPGGTTFWSGSAAPGRSRPISRSRFGRCSRSCGRGASASACCPRSGARAIRPSAPATSTCSRNWPTRISRTSRRPGRRRS